MEIFEVIKRENSKILSTLRKLEDTSAGQPEEREKIFQEAERRIEGLNRVEENYLYPLLQTDDRTEEGARRSRQEVRSIENLLHEMESMPLTDSRFQHYIERLHGEYQTHAEWEENELFRWARDVVVPEQAQMLGARIEGELP